jgi:hypothetical protein
MKQSAIEEAATTIPRFHCVPSRLRGRNPFVESRITVRGEPHLRLWLATSPFVVSLSNHEPANQTLRRNHAKTTHTAFPTQRPAGVRFSHFRSIIDINQFIVETTV